ncbi:hypothetical protein JCM10450v2_002971 [Rhodotorula kratochvilovae]
MLASAARPLAGRASSCASCAVRRTAHSALSPPNRVQPAFARSTAEPRRVHHARGVASYAQAGDQVAEQAPEPAEAQLDASANEPAGEPEQVSPEQAMVNLLEELAAEKNQAGDAEPEPASSSSTTVPSTSPEPSSSSDPTPSSSTSLAPHIPAAPPPPPPAPPKLTMKTLLAPSLPPGGPTLDDLYALRPKRFTIPEASSPDSHRLVYRKSWEASIARFDRAFNKRQLALFAGEDGLNLDLTDPKLRTGTAGKKHKWWKSKRIDQMTKRELIHTILVLEFHMVDPETIPTAKHGPRTSETVSLDDRTLFLLLSPKSPTIPNLTRQLGVHVAFRRNPQTSVIELVLKGTTSGVNAAKEELEVLEHTCAKDEFDLPDPASTLRPEVYQAISRTAKAFLEPGSEPNKLKASAIEPRLVERAQRLVNAAFALHTERMSTALFASIPANLESLKYAMYPFTPLTAPPTILTGGTTHFARVKTLSLTNAIVPSADPAERALSELLEWSERMRLERTARQALYIPTTSMGSSGTTARDASSVWKLLRGPFGEEDAVAVQARFGHVAWPLYRARGDFIEGKTELGPAFSGVWAFARFAEWAESSVKRVKSLFIPAPPTGLLRSTRVLTPLPALAAPAPFASLLSPISDGASIAADAAHAAAQLTDVQAGPALESTTLRRWVYRATGPARRGDATKRVEVEFELENDEETPAVREMRIRRSEVRFVRENKVDVMIPTGSQDAQFSMAATTVLSPDAYPRELDERTMTFHGPNPVHLRLDGTDYLLDTDHLVRRTLITPPASSSSSAAAYPTTLPTVQEAWHSLTRDGTRGTDVFYAVGRDSVRALQRDGHWKRGLEEVEKRCVGREGRREKEGEVGRLVFGR